MFGTRFQTSLNKLKTDEEKLRKLINFVKPFELPEIRPPPPRVIKDEPFEEPPVEPPVATNNAPKVVKTEVKPIVEDIPEPKTEVKKEVPSEETPSK